MSIIENNNMLQQQQQHDYYQLSREKARYDTYRSDVTVFNDIKDNLVKAGFYYTQLNQRVKCFCCFVEIDIDDSFVSSATDFVIYHRHVNPDCLFINGDLNNTFDDVEKHSQKFLSYNSLYYEKERLATFIEWPLPYILPRDLAANGYYYLRTHDHCACAFCRGIVGAWEVGDTPLGEHKRHFPFCPFIRGLTSANVPLEHSEILDGLTLDGEECPIPTPEDITPIASAAAAPDTDVCGRRTTENNGKSKPKSLFYHIVYEYIFFFFDGGYKPIYYLFFLLFYLFMEFSFFFRESWNQQQHQKSYSRGKYYVE